ncbi:MAG: F0F1 ATP synthase subunit B' [Gemmatimonadaceae bacterium]|nr:F0F1 ATP synthase subunit B' [Acetobacteraceae bacterium]
MPQLDFANPLTIAQVVWMVFIFAGLYMLLAQWALPQVATVIDARAERIGADLDTARAAKAQSDAAIAEVTEASRRASADAQAAIATAIATAKTESLEQSRLADEQLTARLAEAEQRIATARTAAMGALRQVAQDTAGAVVTRLTGRTPDAAAIEAAVGTAMAGRA